MGDVAGTIGTSILLAATLTAGQVLLMLMVAIGVALRTDQGWVLMLAWLIQFSIMFIAITIFALLQGLLDVAVIGAGGTAYTLWCVWDLWRKNRRPRKRADRILARIVDLGGKLGVVPAR